MVWYSYLLKIFPWVVVIHIVKGINIISEAEVDVFFLELPCFFSDPKDVDNLISGSSAFSKSSLYIWNFLVHVLLKPSLKDFEHYLASMWNEHNSVVVWTFFFFFFFALLLDWNENWPFPLLEMWTCKWYFCFASWYCIKLCQHGVLERGWRAAGGKDCLLFCFLYLQQ